MKKHSTLQWTILVVFTMLVASLAIGGQAIPQNAPEKTFVVNGKPVSGAIANVQGRTYVDLQLISQALGGTLTIETDRITLVTSSPPATIAPRTTEPATGGASATGERLSVNFRAAAINALGEMRQWQGAVESVITYAVPVVGTWPQDYRDQVATSVSQAKIFAFTDDDHSAFALLQNDFANLTAWSDTVVAERKNLNATRFVDPNALKKDTTLAKITDCSRFLGGMISAGIYADNANCH